MPDGDMFAKSLPRNWGTAGRLAFGIEDDAATIGECQKQLVRELNESPWIGFADAVGDIAYGMIEAEDQIQRRRVLQHLEWYCDRWPADRYKSMRQVANRLLAHGVAPNESTALTRPRESQHAYIASAILTELVMTRIARASMAKRMASTGKMSAERFEQRSRELRDLLQSDPGLQTVGMGLMRSSETTTSRIRIPRNRSRRVPQSELVNLAIG